MPIFSVPAMTLTIPAVTVDGEVVVPGYAIEVPGIEIEVPAIEWANIKGIGAQPVPEVKAPSSEQIAANIDAIRDMLKSDPWEGLKDLKGMPEMGDPRWN